MFCGKCFSFQYDCPYNQDDPKSPVCEEFEPLSDEVDVFELVGVSDDLPEA